MAIDHELTFCSQAAGWMNEILAARPELAFGEVKIEQSVRGSRKRRDLTLYDRSGKVAVTGEVKLPYMPDGHSPFNEDVVEDAVKKALKVGAPFFLTWNVNRLVLWQTDQPGRRLEDRSIHDQTLTRVRDAEDLTAPAFQDDIRRGIVQFLERASAAFRGELPLGRKPLDTFFIGVLEAGLERPILTVQHAIEKKYAKDGPFKVKLDRWMRDTQGWHLSDDELIQRDNLERAAKFSCYVLVNKIVFYLAMRRRWTKLRLLRLAPAVDDARKLHVALMLVFGDAMKASRDYQTIFQGDFGDELPFVTDDSVPAWRDLLESIERFDFTKLNYDVIGPIFERLISPEERHRYGQHYTKPEVVDLINAFCIRRPDAAVLDPSCGGGTFLVRAYARKKFLAARAGTPLPHTDALNQLFGVDISSYATHLTTMNLATRDLIDDQNYPLVAQSDFFDVEAGQALCSVPLGSGGAGGQMQQVFIPKLDAIVGNPPYVRQEEISIPPTAEFKGRARIKSKDLAQIKKEQRAYKQHLQALARAFVPDIEFSGRSDLHVYFWPHAAKLLKDDAHFGFLTSSGWLDVDYGFRLQEFVLRHYAILAIFESQLEPWFTGARVTTCATLLRREPDAAKRNAQLVKFVQLRSLMSEVFPADQNEDERQHAAEALRDRIEGLNKDTTDPHWRVRVIRQGDLWELGLKNGALLGAPGADVDREDEDMDDDTEAGAPAKPDQYYGGKWGIYLRAPELYFDLAREYGDHLVPLSVLAEVRFGVKTGCDKFFFVRDVTQEHLDKQQTPRAFKERWGIFPFQTDNVHIVRAGDKSDHLMEARYLEPEVHNLMETNGVFGIKINRKDLRLLVFLCGEKRADLKGSHALKYIQWGEREGFDDGSTVQQRTSENREWYDLTTDRRGAVFWPKAQQYRHLAPFNDGQLLCNCNLYDVYPLGVQPAVLCGILNSTLIAMHKHLFGRWAGTEGNLKTEVVDVKMMPVPDARNATPGVAKRIRDALGQMMKRPTRNLIDEFSDPGRRALDDAVLELLGITDARERERVRSRLYEEMTVMHRAIRDKELRANENKKRTKRGGGPTPDALASEVWDALDPSLLRRFPEDFLGAEIKDSDTIELHAGKAKVHASPLLGKAELQMDGHSVELGDEARANLALVAHESGRRGPIPVPRAPAACLESLRKYREYTQYLREEFAQLAAEKTASEKLAARVVSILEKRLGQCGNSDIVPPPVLPT